MFELFDLKSNGDDTLHHLDTDLQRFGFRSSFIFSRLEQLQTQQGEPQDIDFGPEVMDIVPDPTDFGPEPSDVNRITLTPPKLPSRKRPSSVRPDLRIELSNELWKRQCTDLTLYVTKRPPLPMDETQEHWAEAIRPEYQDDIQDFLQFCVNIERSLMDRQSMVGTLGETKAEWHFISGSTSRNRK